MYLLSKIKYTIIENNEICKRKNYMMINCVKYHNLIYLIPKYIILMCILSFIIGDHVSHT